MATVHKALCSRAGEKCKSRLNLQLEIADGLSKFHERENDDIPASEPHARHLAIPKKGTRYTGKPNPHCQKTLQYLPRKTDCQSCKNGFGISPNERVRTTTRLFCADCSLNLCVQCFNKHTSQYPSAKGRKGI